MFTLNDVLDLAAQIEKNGERVYRTALHKIIDDPELSEMLAWMADEEARHAEHFDRMREERGEAPGEPLLEELGRSMLADVVANRSFSLEEVDFSRIDAVSDLIRIMIEFEKDTVAFYGVFRDFMVEAKEIDELDRIIADEEEHIRKLENCRSKNLACLKA
ncbi:MAG: ferritin family protein [Desulfobacterales bacterium]|jgi:rubrerythrin